MSRWMNETFRSLKQKLAVAQMRMERDLQALNESNNDDDDDDDDDDSAPGGGFVSKACSTPPPHRRPISSSSSSSSRGTRRRRPKAKGRGMRRRAAWSRAFSTLTFSHQ